MAINSRCDEKWLDVIGFEGLYQVSNLGRVRSLPRHTTKGRVLKLHINPVNGYAYVCLCKNNKKTQRRVHRLVMESFSGISDLQVNHIDGVKTNNCLDNLEYCTQSENMVHAYKTGLEKPKGLKVICLDDGTIYDCASYVENDPRCGCKVLMVCRGLRSHYKGKHYALYEDYVNNTIPPFSGRNKRTVSKSLWR